MLCTVDGLSKTTEGWSAVAFLGRAWSGGKQHAAAAQALFERAGVVYAHDERDL